MTLTAERLRELFRYDPETGVFTRKYKRHQRVCDGVTAAGYIEMRIDGGRYYAHRLAWFYIHGSWAREIDHINLIKNDNRLANLRECHHHENMGNGRMRKNNKSGFKGVHWDRRRSKGWLACIAPGGRTYHLGAFATPEEAHEAYCQAARLMFGEFARAD